MKIVLLTAHSKAYTPLNDITYPTKVKYAEHWNRIFKDRHFSSLSIEREFPDGWGRPVLWLDALNTLEYGDWIFWTGTDAAITNLNFQICYLHNDSDFLFAVDHHGLQSDSWLIRNTPATRKYFQDVYFRRNIDNNEQDAMQVVLSGLPSYGDIRRAYDWNSKLNREDFFTQLFNPPTATFKSRILPREMINALPHEHYGGTGKEEHSYQPGKSIVLHCPGKSLEWRLEWMPKLIAAAKV